MTLLLTPGANAPIRGVAEQPALPVRVEFMWQARRAPPDVALLVVACDARGRALSPFHQVTYRAPSTAQSTSRFEVLVDLPTVPPTIPHVAFALAADGPGPRQLPGLTTTVRTPQGAELARYIVEDLPDWRGLVVVEIYRRSDQWKVRAIGQGLADGYPGLLRSFALAGWNDVRRTRQPPN